MTDYSSKKTPTLPEINVGYIPLIDSAVLIAARVLGEDEKHGFRLNLHKEVSWANIRDKVNVGVYDSAHMLAPMPIAATLGLGHAKEPIIAPFVLSQNGNAICVSNELFAHMVDVDPQNASAGGMAAAKAVAKVVKERQQKNHAPLTFGTVFPFSCHTYELSNWLAYAGVNPVQDIRMIVIPPSLIAESLKAGHIHGFCAGAPWPSVSVIEDSGRIVATNTELWRGSPEKVLGVRQAWVESNPELHANVLRALYVSAKWLDDPQNRAEAAAILARPEYLDLPVEILERPLLGKIQRNKDGAARDEEDFVVFHKDHANFPWRSHALWFLTQMVRWGQLTEPFDLRQAADIIYRPDIYRTALRDIGVSFPLHDLKPEGIDLEAGQAAKPAFFGDNTFNPSDLMNYMNSWDISAPSVDIDALGKLNS